MSDFTTAPESFDSREVIARIEELETFRENANDPELSDEERREAWDEFDTDEYDALTELRHEADHLSDWEYGETFISEGSFTEYAMELLQDVGYLPADLPGWIVIDEDETANNMKMDYSQFEFMGTTYFARA